MAEKQSKKSDKGAFDGPLQEYCDKTITKLEKDKKKDAKAPKKDAGK